jgi:hypothetical protein
VKHCCLVFFFFSVYFVNWCFLSFYFILSFHFDLNSFIWTLLFATLCSDIYKVLTVKVLICSPVPLFCLEYCNLLDRQKK